MKPTDSPNPADLIHQKLEGYIYEPEDHEDDDLILVFERHLLKVKLSEITIKSRDEAI